jgi:hypothetical protein
VIHPLVAVQVQAAVPDGVAADGALQGPPQARRVGAVEGPSFGGRLIHAAKVYYRIVHETGTSVVLINRSSEHFFLIVVHEGTKGKEASIEQPAQKAARRNHP